jgi:hypothetical protein
LALVGVTLGDLRFASQPKNKFKAQDRGKVKFVPEYALYMEPSDFGYAGLKKQRDQRAYDQFLRSNIDNEQDKRNFVTEDGKDHLPFRSYESRANDLHSSVKYKIAGTPAAPAIVATTTVPYIVPLRWNNPHASELEVNIWIMRNGKPVVVPIRKPACSGEGYQDNVFEFTIPKDFSAIGSKVTGFSGCQKVGDCILQVYAHSVESRTYAIGSPLLIKYIDANNSTKLPSANIATKDNLQAAGKDPGTNYANLRKICLPSNDNAVHITKAVPREARLVSDVFNHAYQNSDFSPYSGQQPESISQNMQAACILKMTVGNRGELGKRLLKKENRAGYNKARQLDKKARQLIKTYEGITNQLIAKIGSKMKTTDTMSQNQKTNECFRCAQVGSTTTNRKTTNTYVPSFEIPGAFLKEAAQYVAPAYGHLISVGKDAKGVDVGILQIYSATLKDMEPEFLAIGKDHGIHYLPAATKTTPMATKADVTKFKKVDAAGKKDDGSYAAKAAQTEIKKNQIPVIAGMTKNAIVGSPINNVLCSGSSVAGLQTLIKSENDDNMGEAEREGDMNAVMQDADCDDDAKVAANPDMVCTIPGSNRMVPGQLFPEEGQIEDDGANSAVAMAVSWLSTILIVGNML